MSKLKASTTIRLSDTIDQYSRRVHVNVRNNKVTMVYRWKDRKSIKIHTQRMTLEDAQIGRLIGALSIAVAVSSNGDFNRMARIQEIAETTIEDSQT